VKHPARPGQRGVGLRERHQARRTCLLAHLDVAATSACFQDKVRRQQRGHPATRWRRDPSLRRRTVRVWPPKAATRRVMDVGQHSTWRTPRFPQRGRLDAHADLSRARPRASRDPHIIAQGGFQGHPFHSLPSLCQVTGRPGPPRGGWQTDTSRSTCCANNAIPQTVEHVTPHSTSRH